MSDEHGRLQRPSRPSESVRLAARAASPGPHGDGQHPPELKNLFADLWEHSESLVRQELALAQAELEVRMVHAKAAALRGAISLCLAHAAYLTTLVTLVLVLAHWLEPWIAALIVAVAASSGAALFVNLGKQELRKAITPSEHTPQKHVVRRQPAHP